MCYTYIPTGKCAISEEEIKKLVANKGVKKAMKAFRPPQKLDTVVNVPKLSAQLDHLFKFEAPRFQGGVLLGKVTDMARFDLIDRYGFRRTDNSKKKRPIRTPRPWAILI